MMDYIQIKEEETLSVLLDISQKKRSNIIVIEGESGVGKTSLVRECFNKLYQKNGNEFILYLNIINDLYSSNNIFKNTFYISFYGIAHSKDTISNIINEYSLNKSINKYNKKNNSLYNILKTIRFSSQICPTETIPFAAAADVTLSESINFEEQFSFEKVLENYFMELSKKTRVRIIVDNWQFLDLVVQNHFLGITNQILDGLDLVIINRTTTNNNSIFNIQYPKHINYNHIKLNYANSEFYKDIINHQNLEISDKEIETLYSLTHGNLKETEIILNNKKTTPTFNLIESTIIIKKLGELKKCILILASIFPAGLKEKFLVYIVHDLLNSFNEEQIINDISELINMGYIYKNSKTKDLVKPTHETVINNVREAINLNDFSYIQKNCEKSLEELIDKLKGQEDYEYLLHCLIGIMTLQELKENYAYIEELIIIQFKRNSYYYIASLYKQLHEIVYFLSDYIIEKILVSFQRVSEFKSGINLLTNLRQNNTDVYEKFTKYHIKYLIQMYNFDDALALIEDEKIIDSELLLTKINALEHIGKDDEVEYILKNELPLVKKDEFYYIIKRNTAHHYSYKEADSNLKESLSYFDKINTQFAYATVLNNLGVINIYMNYLSKANEYLKQAYNLLEQICSNEIFEPACNLGVIHLLDGNYDESIKFFNKSLTECPRVLTMDIIMISVNRIICRLLKEEINYTKALESLNDLKENYSIIDDPWYKFHLYYNINEISKFVHNTPLHIDKKLSRYYDEYKSNYTKYYIIKEFDDFSVCLGLSPNWRY